MLHVLIGPFWLSLRKQQNVVGSVVFYAHILIVVAFLVVNFFSFLVIAPSHQLQSGRK